MVNFQKSDVCFGTEVSDEEGEVLAQILGVRKTECHKRYLGLPAFTGRRKTELFGFVRDRVWDKIKSWNGLSLSQAGRKVLIKSVLQSIPSYVASCHKFPLRFD